MLLAVSCPSLLQGSHWHRPIHVQQSLQLHLISCYQLSIYSFFSRTLFDPFFFFSASLHPGTPFPSSLCTWRVLLLKILMNFLSLNRRDLLLTDIWHQVNSGNSGERERLSSAVAGWYGRMPKGDRCAPVLPLHTALPFPPSSPALFLSRLQMRQNIRQRYQGEFGLAVLHMVVITTELVKQNVFWLSSSRKSLLFWNTSGFPKITDDKAQIRLVLWYYNASVSTHIFRKEIGIIFFFSLMLLMFLPMQWMK